MNRQLQRWGRQMLRRIGTPGAVALVLLVPLVAVALWIPSLNRQGDDLRAALSAQADAVAKPSAQLRRTSTRGEQATAFTTGLPTFAQNAADLRAVFDIAQRRNLALPRGEYQLKTDTNGAPITYSITLPVRSEYGALKGFAVEVLETLPHAAMDDLRMARSDAGSSVLDFQVRFTFIYRSL